MKRLPVVALDVVREDVQGVYDYLAAPSPAAAENFLERYFETADRIARNPETFAVRFEDYRRALVPRSNIAIYYFTEPARAVIVAVIDARRDPARIRRLLHGRRTGA